MSLQWNGLLLFVTSFFSLEGTFSKPKRTYDFYIFLKLPSVHYTFEQKLSQKQQKLLRAVAGGAYAEAEAKAGAVVVAALICLEKAGVDSKLDSIYPFLLKKRIDQSILGRICEGRQNFNYVKVSHLFFGACTIGSAMR